MGGTSGTMRAMSDDDQNPEPLRRPWRTPDLSPCVGFKGALEILGVGRMTLSRWLQPGSGTQGPDKTYMVPPARIDSGPFWVTADVERFAVEFGRQRAASVDSPE